MHGPEVTPKEAVVSVLRAYDGVRLQGYDHEYAVGFLNGRLRYERSTIERALDVRRRDPETYPPVKLTGQC